MALEVDVDPTRCNASAACVRLAPGVFHIDRGKAMVIDPDACSQDAVLVAASECPTGAITVTADGAPLT